MGKGRINAFLTEDKLGVEYYKKKSVKAIIKAKLEVMS